MRGENRRLYVAVDGFGGDSTQIQFILASATIGNPVDLASRLLHRSPTQGDEDTIAWVQESGAQRPERHIHPQHLVLLVCRVSWVSCATMSHLFWFHLH